jgi:hypothetical protein
MGHVLHIQNRQQFIEALGVLNDMPGMWHACGNPSSPVLLVTDTHFKALVKAGVVSDNGKEGKARGKKANARLRTKQ